MKNHNFLLEWCRNTNFEIEMFLVKWTAAWISINSSVIPTYTFWRKSLANTVLWISVLKFYLAPFSKSGTRRPCLTLSNWKRSKFEPSNWEQYFSEMLGPRVQGHRISQTSQNYQTSYWVEPGVLVREQQNENLWAIRTDRPVLAIRWSLSHIAIWLDQKWIYGMR